MVSEADSDLRREFRDREDLLAYLRAEFPGAQGNLSPTIGGRVEAERRLAAFDASQYAASRNFLQGEVSRLSAFIRHGVLSLRDVMDSVRARYAVQQVSKFVQELGWRDYWRRVYAKIGDGVWQDREASKTGVRYSSELPANLGRTTLACMDAFARDLESTGYLHNHARLWVAAYLVHWRSVSWQAGARWFLRHLIDGDPASNNLSWQWVASTFSAKPYIFNRESLELLTEGVYCATCARRFDCPFDKSYETLAAELFPQAEIE